MIKLLPNLRSSAILGAAFLMATSAIGPGFLTQTTLFTRQLGASLGFVILISVLIDIGAQVNIWRVLTTANAPVQTLSNRLLPGLGIVLTVLIATGSLIFNIGNIGGAALGVQTITGIPVQWGAWISMALALALFWYREAGRLMDQVVKMMGLLMLVLTAWVAFAAHPPLGEALVRTVWPAQTDTLKIVTLVGGTVGGYISFAGAHRLLDAGISGPEQVGQVTRSAVSGIVVTAAMRYILFLGALGVVWAGHDLDQANPAASVFELAAGAYGRWFFGWVLWFAAITSVIGASFTTMSFCRTLHPLVARYEKIWITVFISASTVIFQLNPKPVQLLVFAGAANGFILPLALSVILIAARRPALLNGYQLPWYWQAAGWCVVAVMGWMVVVSYI